LPSLFDDPISVTPRIASKSFCNFQANFSTTIKQAQLDREKEQQDKELQEIERQEKREQERLQKEKEKKEKEKETKQDTGQGKGKEEVPRTQQADTTQPQVKRATTTKSPLASKPVPKPVPKSKTTPKGEHIHPTRMNRSLTSSVVDASNPPSPKKVNLTKF